MNMTELSKLTLDELNAKMREAQAELQRLRFDIATMKETKVHKVEAQRKLIARIQTLINQQKKHA
jgi:ribosomal protein L29